MEMYMWLLENTTELQYDTYNTLVVAARSEAEAVRIRPDSARKNPFQWPKKEYVKVTKIGTAAEGVVTGVVLESYQAG